MSLGAFIRLGFCPLRLLSVGPFVRWAFCPLGLLSVGLFSTGLFSTGLLSVGILSAGLSSAHPREIACHVTVKMPGTIKNHLIMDRCQQLVLYLYTEPKDEEILRSFLVSIPEPLPTPSKSSFPRKRKVASNPVVNTRYKRKFKATERARCDEEVNIPTIIEID